MLSSPSEMRALLRRIRRHGLTQSRAWGPDPRSGRPSVWATALLIAGLASLTPACNQDDTGICCQVLSGRDPNLVPKPEKAPSGEWINAIKLDPAFDCSNLTCVSYQGTNAFCTKACQEVGDCPEGFACEPVLQSDPGPGSNIQPGDKFCVKVGHACTE